MKEYRTVLLEKIRRTPTVISFRLRLFEKIDFLAGQFMQVRFSENDGDRDMNKYLSFSSSPTKEYIEFTKRISDSAFSERLLSLKPQNEVLIKAPLGNCFFNPKDSNITFLIGGIGITAVISIIEYIVEENLDTVVNLFYSNRNEEEIAFKPELDSWAKNNQNLRIFYTVTDCLPKDKKCLYGVINKEMVLNGIGADINKTVFFIYGPPKMVEVMKELCLNFGCNEERIKQESFIGY
jgi:ferredoxin-NADP reductase